MLKGKTDEGAGSNNEVPRRDPKDASKHLAKLAKNRTKTFSRVAKEAVRQNEQWKKVEGKIFSKLKEVGIDQTEFEEQILKLFSTKDDNESARLAHELEKRYGAILQQALPERSIGLVNLPLTLTPLSGPGGGTAPGPLFPSWICAFIPWICGPCIETRLSPGEFFWGSDGHGHSHLEDRSTGSFYTRGRDAIARGGSLGWSALRGELFVEGGCTNVVVVVEMDIQVASVTNAGIGFSHGWAAVNLDIDAHPSHRNTAEARMELINAHHWFAGFGVTRERPSGPVTLIAAFNRIPTSSTEQYHCDMEATIAGTVIGAAGVDVSVGGKVRAVTIRQC